MIETKKEENIFKSQTMAMNYIKKKFPNFKINVVKKDNDKNIGKVLTQDIKPNLDELIKLLRWYNTKGWEIFLDLNSKNIIVLDDIKGNREEIFIKFNNIAQCIIETSKNNYHIVLRFNEELNDSERKEICKKFNADLSHAHSTLTRFPCFISKKNNYFVKLHADNENIILNKEKFLNELNIVLEKQTPTRKEREHKKTTNLDKIPDQNTYEELLLKYDNDYSRADFAFCFRCYNAGLSINETADILETFAKIYNRKKSNTYFLHTAQKAWEKYIPPKPQPEL